MDFEWEFVNKRGYWGKGDGIEKGIVCSRRVYSFEVPGGAVVRARWRIGVILTGVLCDVIGTYRYHHTFPSDSSFSCGKSRQSRERINKDERLWRQGIREEEADEKCEERKTKIRSGGNVTAIRSLKGYKRRLVVVIASLLHGCLGRLSWSGDGRFVFCPCSSCVLLLSSDQPTETNRPQLSTKNNNGHSRLSLSQ